ncbi:MAG: transglutaminase family protein [Acidobacteriota bacterium]|nr:transglutaminase family protein [Acidobacteriota bacterium]
MVASSVAVATPTPDVRNVRRFALTMGHALDSSSVAPGDVRLWVPLPDEQEFQHVSPVKFYFDGNYSDAWVTVNNDCGARTLFATWSRTDRADRDRLVLTVGMDVDTIDWAPAARGDLKAWRAPEKLRYPKDVAVWLQPSAHLPVGGVVKKTAGEILGGAGNSAADPLARARCLYGWVTENMRYAEGEGCGTGDARGILQNGRLAGDSIDICSVFVALVRAAGIPARAMTGLRLGVGRESGRAAMRAVSGASGAPSALADVGGEQRCRAMFYLAGFGWVPCDPAESVKARETGMGASGRERLFGNWEMNWVGFNWGRDFALWPEARRAVNYFAAPYAEADGAPDVAFAREYTSLEG